MSLKDRYELELLVNEAERLVFDELEERLEDEKYTESCKCNDCVLDMSALALNMVKPAYRVSLLGSLYAKVIDETAYAKEVAAAVDKAIEKVTNNPGHEV